MSVDDQFTKSLLHFDGVDASTTFLDESGKAWTRYGDAQISTAQKKFGASSALFDGNGDYISTPSHADFDLSTGDFTVDCWFRFSQTPNASATEMCQRIIANGIVTSMQGAWCLGVYSDTINFAYYIGAVYNRNSSAISVSANVWYHLALVRASGTVYFYLNGVPKGSGVCLDRLVTTESTMIGTRAGTSIEYFPGNIDELRFSKGIARWTSDFSSNLPTSFSTFFLTLLRPFFSALSTFKSTLKGDKPCQ